jgi:hypothetical protein
MRVAEQILTPDGTRFVAPDGSLLTSLATINQLPEDIRDQIYHTLLIDELFERFAIDRVTLRNSRGEKVVIVDAPPNIGLIEIRTWRQLSDRDPVTYIQLADTVNNQMLVMLYVTNDPDAPRFPVDRDWGGEPTKFGTLTRNVEAEVEAMNAGLAPGQVRRGLRISRKLLPAFECFVSRLGHNMYLMEPLAYHTAILFEDFGCSYSQGRRRMERFHQEFQPGGELFRRLDGSTPFRQSGMEKTVRGRSWAIHDGILGEPFTDYHMYKIVGKHAGLNTFPDRVW